MNTINKNDFSVPQVALGCMRISNLEKNELDTLINTALEHEINFFDHADIYGGGMCEKRFGEFMAENKSKRDDMIIQSKCGIKKGLFDFSKEHIIWSLENSLKNLNVDYLDSFLLHRPDALFEPEEVAIAFETLKKQGKVKHFGVSNHNPYQIELLKKYCDIEINQIQLSIAHAPSIDFGLNSNMVSELGINRDGSVIDYCRLNDILIQAWSPLQFGMIKGVFIDNSDYKELNDKLAELADKYNTTKTAVAIAWINRHPAKIQTITGTTNKNRVIEIANSTKFTLTREEWYALYLSTGKKLP